MGNELKVSDGKIFSHIRNKWLVLTPEEMVRQEYLLQLVNIYGYSLNQIAEELEVTGRGSAGARADFVIWKTEEDKKNKKSPIIVIECKAENISMDERVYLQGELYARQTNAPFFVTHNNKQTKYWRILKDRVPGYRQEIEDIPKANSTEKEIEELLKKLKVFKENEFADLLHQCHNIIRNREKLDPAAAFDEIAKILFMKVYAERNLKADMKGNIFTLEYIEQGEKFNPDYIYDIFDKTKKEFGRDKLFNSVEKINLRISTIKAIVEKLEVYNLSATSTDVKGIAFEKFLGRTFRGEIGQFFTPRKIVEFIVEMIDPKEGEIIVDPASGSGGFLIRFFEIVGELINEAIDAEYKKNKEEIEAQNDLTEVEKANLLTEKYEKLTNELDPTVQESRMWTLANRCVYGVDANERMARTSKMNMIMHGDGHGGIHHNDGFININGVFDGRFDIVLTNPPFGQTVEEEDVILNNQLEVDDGVVKYYKEAYGEEYEKFQKQLIENIGNPITSIFELPKGKSIKTEILFIERCLSLLKPGGRLGIVLPEGILNNPSLSYVREFAENRAKVTAVISLPQETFFSSGASVKASILFMQKYTDEEKQIWDSLLEESKNAILLTQVKEREKIENVLKDKKVSKEIKKQNKEKLKELDQLVEKEGREKAKFSFNYPIFMAEASHVGITATGEEDENDLPYIIEEYKKFRNDPTSYIKNREL